MKVDDKTYPFIWRLCFRSALFLAMVVVGISVRCLMAVTEHFLSRSQKKWDITV